MNSATEVRYPTRAPLDPYDSRFADINLHSGRKERAGHIKRVLRNVGLTMTEVSTITQRLYGRGTDYFIPPTTLFKQSRGISPHLCQIAAFSRITGYRFSDCLRLYGFDLELVFSLQLEIHSERTVLITPTHASRVHSTLSNCEIREPSGRYLFAKIGTGDAVVYPTILPGSIVRADRSYSMSFSCGQDNGLWLVEHPAGLTCCHLKWLDRETVILLPNRPPLSRWPLRLWKEVQILGRVDLEWRTQGSSRARPVSHPIDSRLPQQSPCNKNTPKFSAFLRRARCRSGLTLRRAHEMSRRVAETLGRREYAIALGQLSDYEAADRLPRHIAKIFSLCAIYGIDLFDLMQVFGIEVDDSGAVPLPEFLGSNEEGRNPKGGSLPVATDRIDERQRAHAAHALSGTNWVSAPSLKIT